MVAMQWWTLPQAAADIGLNRTRIYQLVAAGRIRAQRFGRQWAIHQRDWRAFKSEYQRQAHRGRANL